MPSRHPKSSATSFPLLYDCILLPYCLHSIGSGLFLSTVYIVVYLPDLSTFLQKEEHPLQSGCSHKYICTSSEVQLLRITSVLSNLACPRRNFLRLHITRRLLISCKFIRIFNTSTPFKPAQGLFFCVKLIFISCVLSYYVVYCIYTIIYAGGLL